MKSTPEEIEAALANFRKISAERNRRSLQVFVDAIINADFEDEETGNEFTKEEMDQERMGQLREIVEDDLDGLTHPAELMDHFDELAPKLSLDGTSGGGLDPEERANLAEAYFEALEAVLKEKAPDKVKDTMSAPGEFRVLARHVLGVCGPGLPKEHTEHDMSFWSDESIGNHAKIPSRMLEPDDIPGKLALDERAKLALGWVPGSTVNCDWTCVYVQESEDSSRWVWKFVWSDPSDSRVFDTIPELLEWFLEFTDEDPPVLEGVTAENVIDREVWSLR